MDISCVAFTVLFSMGEGVGSAPFCVFLWGTWIGIWVGVGDRCVSSSVGCWRVVGELDGSRRRRNGIVDIPAGGVEHVGIGVVAIRRFVLMTGRILRYKGMALWSG